MSPAAAARPPAPGARVAIRDEEWLVRRVEQARPGGHAIHAVGTSGVVAGMEAIFLTELDVVTELRPEETQLVHDASPQYRDSRLYLESLLRRTPPPDGDARIYLGHLGAIRPANYQLQPAAKALRQLRPRILFADGVGLGKTIEVGVLLTELIERGRADRILVVALKSILPQFQQELWARFTIPLVRLDSVGIQRVQSRIPSSMNPFHYYDHAIISIDTLKKDAKYRRYLEEAPWDVIVIDECQNVALRSNSQSQRARLAQLLARKTDTLIFTSATPHDGSASSFASLMNLLEPTAVANEEHYTHEDVREYFVRRFKKDIAHEVEGAFRERTLDPRHVDATPEENAVFERFRGLEFRSIASVRNSRGILFRTLLLKSFLSSPAACRSTIDERCKKLEDPKTQPAAASAADIEHDLTVLRELRSAVDAVTPDRFTKYSQLLEVLYDLGYAKPANAERVVIFSERIDTLEFLREHLAADLDLAPGENLDLFHGAMTDKEQTDLVRRFGTRETPLRILLASDAASEGLNLHYFCHRIIHFDLPWSLITLEQRNGRVDRYGQREQPILTYLLTRPADPELQGDLRILDRLIEKEQQAHLNVGDAAWLMGLHDAAKEERRIADAIETREDPELAIPDEPASDWLADLLGSDGAAEADAEVTRRPSLFPDDAGRPGSGDLRYCLEATQALFGDQPELVESHPHLDGMLLRAPDSLAHRLRYLPPELQEAKDGDRAVFRLTIDRERVMAALEAAREHEDGWPEWQLLWEQHPICEWLDDSVAAHFFAHHAAPVMRVTAGLAPDATALLFQGQLTNLRGQPVVVEWFAVVFDGDRVQRIASLGDVIHGTHLDRPQANPGHALAEVARAHLEALREPAVTAAREHMMSLRQQRMAALSSRLREGLQKVRTWRDARLALLEAQQAQGTRDGRELPAPQRRRIQRDRDEAERQYSSRAEWIEQGMKTHQDPHLRLAAVLVPAS